MRCHMACFLKECGATSRPFLSTRVFCSKGRDTLLRYIVCGEKKITFEVTGGSDICTVLQSPFSKRLLLADVDDIDSGDIDDR